MKLALFSLSSTVALSHVKYTTLVAFLRHSIIFVRTIQAKKHPFRLEVEMPQNAISQEIMGQWRSRRGPGGSCSGGLSRDRGNQSVAGRD